MAREASTTEMRREFRGVIIKPHDEIPDRLPSASRGTAGRRQRMRHLRQNAPESIVPIPALETPALTGHTARAHPDELLAGVSINPQRRDAIDELHRCADAGAVLVKVLPNAKQFDPANPRYKDYDRALAERKLPFLSHVGYEFSLIGKNQSVGDPDRLRPALDEGVTVIAAHACSYGVLPYKKFLPTRRDLVQRYPRFYAAISALTLPNRMRMLLRLRTYPEVHKRFLFGTDYPLSVFHAVAWGRVALGTLRNIIKTTNHFDRQVEVCRGLTLGFRSIGDFLTPASASPRG